MRGSVGTSGARPRMLGGLLAMVIGVTAMGGPGVAATPTPFRVPSQAPSATPTPTTIALPAPPPPPLPMRSVAPSPVPSPVASPSTAPSPAASPTPYPPVAWRRFLPPRAALHDRSGDEWAGDHPPKPIKEFKRRTFPLPRSVDWKLLFPAGRWKGEPGPTGPLDADGIPMRRWVDKILYYTPTNLGIQALRRLDGYRITGDPAYLASARRLADKLRELAIPEGAAIWLPFPYNDRKAQMRAPWVNALGQAVALALFSRLHRLEGRADDLEFAVGLFESFRQLKRPDGPWVSEVDADGELWFEHYPDGLRGHVLNAHAYAVLAIRDYWQETRSPEARRWLEGGLTTLRDKAMLFRRPGTWSWYNLRDPAAHANYHLFHIRELRALTPASGDPWFANLGDLFATDFTWHGADPWLGRGRPPKPTAPGFGNQAQPEPTPAASPTPGAAPAPGPEAQGPRPSAGRNQP